MDDTLFQVLGDKLERFATNYGPAESGGLKVIDHPSTSPFAKETKYHSGGGGLVSTAWDYFRFCQMLLNGGELNGARILSPKTIEMMTLDHVQEIPYGGGPVVFPNPGCGFGLGFNVVKDPALTALSNSIGTYGWGGLAGTNFRIDPQEEMIQILMIQLIPYNTLQIRQDFQVLSYQAIVE